MSLSPADLKQLQAAKNLLENPGLTAQLTSLLGTPIEYGLKKLPRKVNEKLGSVIEGALLKVARSATATLQENASGQPANRLHTLGAAVSGGVGGFFGPLAMLVEVPVTTGIISALNRPVSTQREGDTTSVIDAIQSRLDQLPEMMRIRRQTVEHPFGTLKAWMGATHFLTKTLNRVSTEMSLHVLAYNLKRLMSIFGVTSAMEAMRA